MILKRQYFAKIPLMKKWWTAYSLRKIAGEKLFKNFFLHKTEWPDRLYFYSPRLRRIPQFTGNTGLLSAWKNAKLCETLCPTNAIEVKPQTIIIDNRGCISCGLCVELSPPGLLEWTRTR